MSILDELAQYAPSAKGKGGLAKNVLGGLGALYFGNQAYDNLGSSVGAIDSNIDAIQRQMSGMPSVDSLYGTNSPYAIQMAQTLARKDAAAGRNSQYGPRAAQYAALMADKYGSASRDQAAITATLNKQLADLANLKTQQSAGQSQVRAQQLAQLFNVADNLGWTKKLDDGLSTLFGNGDSQMGYQPSGNEGMSMVDQYAAYGAGQPAYEPQPTTNETLYGDVGYGDTWTAPAATDPGTGGWDNGDPYQWY